MTPAQQPETAALLNSLGIFGPNIRHDLATEPDPKLDPEVAALTADGDWCVCGRIWPCEALQLVGAIETDLRAARSAAPAPVLEALREITEWGDKSCQRAREKGLHDRECPIDRARALLAAAPPVREPEGLDVAWLAQAMEAAGSPNDRPPLSKWNARQRVNPLLNQMLDRESYARLATSIAAEYARLTPERPADEGVDG